MTRSLSKGMRTLRTRDVPKVREEPLAWKSMLSAFVRRFKLGAEEEHKNNKKHCGDGK